MRLSAVLSILFLAVILAGCAQYNEIGEGVNSIGKMRVTAESGWKSAPGSATPYRRNASRTWTIDGLDTDRLMFIPGVGDGEALFKAPDGTVVLPDYQAGMTAEEVAKLVEQSITELFGERDGSVSTSNVRPQGFGEFGGFMFDIAGRLEDGREHGGFAGGFFDEEELYLSIFIAVKPEAYEKHKDAAMELIKSATLTRRTIEMR